jgi:transmembrane sensor
VQRLREARERLGITQPALDAQPPLRKRDGAERFTPRVGTRRDKRILSANTASWRSSAIGIAAALVAIIILAPHTRRSTGHAPNAVTPASHYATGTARTAIVRLADGSRVTLAPRTTISVGNDASGRHVTLMGEAHFEIVPSSHTPFTVRTGAVTTQVLGTTFDVRRYPNELEGRIVVRDGKVRTTSAGTSVTLAAGMTGRFTDSLVVGMSNTDSTAYTSWNSNELVFHDAPLPVVLATLERWYGYTFRVSDPTLSSEKVTAVFDIGNAPEMMRRLKRVLGVGMTFRDSVVTLRGRVPTHDAKERKNTLPPATLSHSTEVGR